jgi:type IV pilus assembly protein PilA
MAVLVGVLAPQFIKYVEQSRRSRDIQTAQEIREAVLADIADNSITGSGTLNPVASNPSTINETPLGAGSVAKSQSFTAHYDAVSGTCYVTLGSSNYTLTTESGASAYKQA